MILHAPVRFPFMLAISACQCGNRMLRAHHTTTRGGGQYYKVYYVSGCIMDCYSQ